MLRGGEIPRKRGLAFKLSVVELRGIRRQPLAGSRGERQALRGASRLTVQSRVPWTPIPRRYNRRMPNTSRRNRTAYAVLVFLGLVLTIALAQHGHANAKVARAGTAADDPAKTVTAATMTAGSAWWCRYFSCRGRCRRASQPVDSRPDDPASLPVSRIPSRRGDESFAGLWRTLSLSQRCHQGFPFWLTGSPNLHRKPMCEWTRCRP